MNKQNEVILKFASKPCQFQISDDSLAKAQGWKPLAVRSAVGVRVDYKALQQRKRRREFMAH